MNHMNNCALGHLIVHVKQQVSYDELSLVWGDEISWAGSEDGLHHGPPAL